MPLRETATTHRYIHASPECWDLYTEVLATEYGNGILFGQVHRLTVDAYAVQHPGGKHPDKSIDIHLVGLHLVLCRGLRPPSVPPLLQRLAGAVETWPHFSPPADLGSITVFDVAMADSMEEHAGKVQEWARSVWQAWSTHHAAVAEFAARYL